MKKLIHFRNISLSFLKKHVHNGLRWVFMGVIYLLKNTAGEEKPVCIVCNYPKGGNSICGEACKQQHTDRERFSQTKEFWRSLSDPENKQNYMKMMQGEVPYTEEDFERNKMRYLG